MNLPRYMGKSNYYTQLNAFRDRHDAEEFFISYQDYMHHPERLIVDNYPEYPGKIYHFTLIYADWKTQQKEEDKKDKNFTSS